MNTNQKRQVELFLKRLHSFEGELAFHHGQCVGADEEAAKIAKALGIWTVAHPPTDKRYLSKFVSDETREPKDFLDRNHDIVDECDVLLATPKTVEVLRSGTWATIRYGRKTKGPDFVTVIEG